MEFLQYINILKDIFQLTHLCKRFDLVRSYIHLRTYFHLSPNEWKHCGTIELIYNTINIKYLVLSLISWVPSK